MYLSEVCLCVCVWICVCVCIYICVCVCLYLCLSDRVANVFVRGMLAGWQQQSHHWCNVIIAARVVMFVQNVY